MSRPSCKLLELPLEQRAFMALKAAVRKVIEEHARAGLSVYVWSDGKVVEMRAESLRAYSRRRRSRAKRGKRRTR